VAPFSHRLRVRYHECDAQGIVFNANHFAYVDVALTELWREAFGSYGAMVERGVDLVVAEATARFLAPTRFDDEVDIVLGVEHVGTTSLVTRTETRRGDDVLVQGSIRHVCVDPLTLGKQPFPADVRAALGTYR
jgi:acyl-CoA thioester hydrolase